MPGFDDILGHDSIKQHMKKAIESRKISHAYILAGEAGMGKKSLARAFALTLMCEEGGSRPCLKCHACRQVLADSHPDLIWVSHEKPQTIGVDDVREQINDTILIRPYSGSHKIYFVDQAEKMTVQAQNALLKTIEEPPDYGIIFLLTANPDAFLPTILSRCVQLKLRPLSDSMVRDYLTKRFSVSEEGVLDDDQIEIIPCRISSTDNYNNYQPTPAQDTEADRILERINEYSAEFGTSFAVSDGSAVNGQ